MLSGGYFKIKQSDDIKNWQNVMSVVHVLSLMLHIVKAGETEFSFKCYLHNKRQSCLHSARFWKILTNDKSF